MVSYSCAQISFVQFIATDIQSSEEASALSTFINQHAGIASSRAEAKDNNVLIFLHEGVFYTKDEIRAWTEFASYELSCFRTGVVGTTPILRLTSANCTETSEETDE
jgi:hypothetical protein